MKFRKINDNTINCIITQDDLKKHGIDLDDLFDRKKNAVEFIKAIIVKAARSVNLNIKNEYTSMRLSILPDQSVSLTISQDPAETARISRAKKTELKNADDGAPHRDMKSKGSPDSDRRAGMPEGTSLFVFETLLEMSQCCRILATEKGIRSAVYFDKNAGVYYLILEKGPDADEQYDSIVLSVNEFGRMVTCSGKTLAYLKEHSECVVKSGAAQKIAEVYS